jgi:hypothetical protein
MDPAPVDPGEPQNQILLPDLGPPPAPAGKKHDDFYKYWDRFTSAKGKAKSKAEPRGEPSLDRDVEGRPGHKLVRSNTEGVVSRYVCL